MLRCGRPLTSPPSHTGLRAPLDASVPASHSLPAACARPPSDSTLKEELGLSGSSKKPSESGQQQPLAHCLPVHSKAWRILRRPGAPLGQQSWAGSWDSACLTSCRRGWARAHIGEWGSKEMERCPSRENTVRLNDSGRFQPILYLGVSFLLKEAAAVTCWWLWNSGQLAS